MRTRRSLNLVLAVGVALLAAGTTFAWAGVLVGGHRADHIGTFEPVARHLVPASDPAAPSAAPTAPPTAASSSALDDSTGTRPPEPSTFLTPATGLTTASPGERTAQATASPPTTTRHSDDSKKPAPPDNGRSNDD